MAFAAGRRIMRNSTLRNLILSIVLIVILIIIAAIVIFRITDTGKSGKSRSSDSAGTAQAASPTQAPVEAVPDDEEEIIEMEKEKEKEETDGFKNVIGEKSAVSSKVIITNETAFEITALYLRRTDAPKTETAWGQELFRGKFTLKDKDQALYYYTEPNTTASTGSSYDIRMVFNFGGSQSTEEIDNVPFTGIREITLHLDVSGDYGVGYAECTGTDGKKYSTREQSGSDQKTESDTTPTPVPEERSETPAEPVQTPEPEEENTEIFSDEATAAARFIGQPFGNLESAMGSPSGSDYEDEPDTGMTGYHFYDTFTVSTTVDENGNEIVSGIW